MLVLSRKTGDTIKIDDEITLTVKRIKGSTVYLGLEAPRTVRIVRGELLSKERSKDWEQQ